MRGPIASVGGGKRWKGGRYFLFRNASRKGGEVVLGKIGEPKKGRGPMSRSGRLGMKGGAVFYFSCIRRRGERLWMSREER